MSGVRVQPAGFFLRNGNLYRRPRMLKALRLRDHNQPRVELSVQDYREEPIENSSAMAERSRIYAHAQQFRRVDGIDCQIGAEDFDFTKGNVLHLIYGFLEGGTEHQLLQLTRLLQESETYKVRIACLTRTGNLLEAAERLVGPIPEFPIKSFYGPQTFVQLRCFARFLREHEIDVVHTHDFYSNIFGMAGAALGARGRIASRRETEGCARCRRSSSSASLPAGACRCGKLECCPQPDSLRRVCRQEIVTLYNGLDLDRVRKTREGWRREEALEAFDLPSIGYIARTIMANMRWR